MKSSGPLPARLEQFRVPDQRWLSFTDAAAVLAIGEFHVGLLTYIDVLDLAIDSSDERGVTRAAVDAELEWRRRHGRARRVWRMAKGIALNGF